MKYLQYISPESDSLCPLLIWQQTLFEWWGRGREVLSGRLEKDMVLHLGLYDSLFLSADSFNALSSSSSPFVLSFRFNLSEKHMIFGKKHVAILSLQRHGDRKYCHLFPQRYAVWFVFNFWLSVNYWIVITT